MPRGEKPGPHHGSHQQQQQPLQRRPQRRGPAAQAWDMARHADWLRRREEREQQSAAAANQAVTHDCDCDVASSVSSNVLLTHLPSSTNSVEEWSSEPMPDVGAQPPAMDGQQLGDPLAGDQQAGGVDQQQQWST